MERAEMKPLGECRVKMINSKTEQKYVVKFVDILDDFHPLLGERAIQKIALITVNNEKFRVVARLLQQDKCCSQHPHEILSEFKDVFEDELGQLPGEVHLEVDSSVTPHVVATRRIPGAINGEFEAELKRLIEKEGVEPVSEPTP